MLWYVSKLLGGVMIHDTVGAWVLHFLLRATVSHVYCSHVALHQHSGLAVIWPRGLLRTVLHDEHVGCSSIAISIVAAWLTRLPAFIATGLWYWCAASADL